jgi:hypothetical protein
VASWQTGVPLPSPSSPGVLSGDCSVNEDVPK